MRTFLGIVALFLLTVLSRAQVTGELTCSGDRVKGLQYVSDTNYTGQRATFVVTLAMKPGYTLDGIVGWTGTGGVYAPPQYSNPHIYNWDAPRAEEVGVTYRAKQTSTGTVLAPQTLKLKLAAIGGPLTLTAKPYAGNPDTFRNDQRDVAKPVYVQYFDYGHATPPSSIKMQKTQDAMAAVDLAQPTGTKMAWTYGTFRCPELVADPNVNLSSITVQAESANQVTVACKFTYDDGAGLSGPSTPVADDTATTPQNPV